MNDKRNIEKLITEKTKGRGFKRLLPVGAIRASVLMPLIETDDGLGILFEVRSKHIGQPGEVCFPGGRIEEGESPEETCVRETMEELLVPEKNIEITAPMFRMLGPGGADVFSYVGFLHDYHNTFSKNEVANVFVMPVDELLGIEPSVGKSSFVQTPEENFPYDLIPGGRDYRWADIKRRYYFYETKYGVIWGMTGILLYHLLEYIKAL